MPILLHLYFRSWVLIVPYSSEKEKTLYQKANETHPSWPCLTAGVVLALFLLLMICVQSSRQIVWRNLCLVSSLNQISTLDMFLLHSEIKIFNGLHFQNRKLGMYTHTHTHTHMHVSIRKINISLTSWPFSTYWHIFFKLWLDSLSKLFAHTNPLFFLSLSRAFHPFIMTRKECLLKLPKTSPESKVCSHVGCFLHEISLPHLTSLPPF